MPISSKIFIDSPRKASSVFVLCNSNLVPSGTAFIVSPTRVITAFHNVGSLKTRRPYPGALVLVRGLERQPDGTVDVIDTDVIPVKVANWSCKSDWALLSRTDGLQFLQDNIVDICPDDAIPKYEDEAKIKIYHCPVILFNQEEVSLVRPISVESRIGMSSTHSFLFQFGLFAGSSGALVVLSGSGLAIGMYLEAINSARPYSEIVDAHRAAGQSDDGTFEDDMTEVTDSCVQSAGALSKAIILSRYKDIMSKLNVSP